MLKIFSRKNESDMPQVRIVRPMPNLVTNDFEIKSQIQDVDIVPSINIDHIEDLPEGVSALYDLIKLPTPLRQKYCPLDLSFGNDKKEFALLLRTEDCKSDITEQITKEILEKGYSKSSPFLYITNNSVLSELARQDKDGRGSIDTREFKGVFNKVNSEYWHMFEDIQKFCLKEDVSDLHFKIDNREEYSQIRFKIDGRLASPTQFNIATKQLHLMLAYLFNVHGLAVSENTYNQNKSQQCRIETDIGNVSLTFRWASSPWKNGVKVVFRVLKSKSSVQMKSFAESNFFTSQQNIWHRALRNPQGGIVIAGKVGQGKSTTLQTAMLNIPDDIERYTIEDPVEYDMPGVTQIDTSRSMDEVDIDPFIQTKRQIKRMDPGAVMIGEIRDFETADLFRNIIESGHKALGSLHAPSAIDLLTIRLVSEEFKIPRDVIATQGFLDLLSYQALVPCLCPDCSSNATDVYEAEYLKEIENLFDMDISSMRARNVEGCESCIRDGMTQFNGLKGRKLVAEMIEVDMNMLNFVKTSQNSELVKYWRNLRITNNVGFDKPDSTGKNAMEIAMYHAATGTVDPREIEVKFGDFETYKRTYRL